MVRAGEPERPSPLGRNAAQTYPEPMNAIHLTDEELEIARHALQSFLLDFGHDEADTLGKIRQVIAKLDAAGPDGEEPRYIA